MRLRQGYIYVLCLAVAGAIAVLPAAVSAAPPAAGTAAAPVSAETKDEGIYGHLAQTWELLLKGDNAEAYKRAEPLTRLKEPKYEAVCIEAGHIQARSLWAAGNKQSRSWPSRRGS